MKKEVTIDLITQSPNGDEFMLILVEEGPWDEPITDEKMRDIQERIYNAVDGAIDGYLSKKYPDAKGKKVSVQIDCYDPPTNQVSVLVKRLSQFLETDAEYKAAIINSEHVDGLKIIYREGKI